MRLHFRFWPHHPPHLIPALFFLLSGFTDLFVSCFLSSIDIVAFPVSVRAFLRFQILKIRNIFAVQDFWRSVYVVCIDTMIKLESMTIQAE